MSKLFGFVPEYGYALAAEPVVLALYINMHQALAQTSLGPIHQQVALAAASRVYAAQVEVEIHANVAEKLGASADVVEVLRDGGSFVDTKLEAVRRFATAIALNRTQVSDSDVNALTAAGYNRRAAVAIALAVSAATLVNTVGHLSHAEPHEGLG